MGIPHYDDLDINDNMLLDLIMRNGTGGVLQDVSKNSHHITMPVAPTWIQVGADLMVLDFDGAANYVQCAHAACAASLGFTTGDYSIGMWINWAALPDSQILIAKYELNTGGWELYLYVTGALTMRHHHAGGVATRSGCYSMGWTTGTWQFIGFTRVGAVGQFYRNGVPLTTIGALEDAEATTRDLVLGTRYTKDANWYHSMMYRPRVWDRALTRAEWAQIYHREVENFA